jgi:hypothetical protein
MHGSRIKDPIRLAGSQRYIGRSRERAERIAETNVES